ncbi:hypothetical protein [Spirosoma gilvum]
MKNLRLSLMGLFLMSISQNLLADMIPRGNRRVESCFRLANVDKYPTYVFLAYSQERFGDRYTVLGKDVCVDMRKQSHTTIYAIAKARFDEGAIKAIDSDSTDEYDQKYGHYFTSNPNLIRTGTEIYPHDFIPESDSAIYVEDILMIQSLTSDTLMLNYDSAIFTYADGRKDKRAWEDVEQKEEYSLKQNAPELAQIWMVAGGIAILSIVAVLYVRNRKR